MATVVDDTRISSYAAPDAARPIPSASLAGQKMVAPILDRPLPGISGQTGGMSGVAVNPSDTANFESATPPGEMCSLPPTNPGDPWAYKYVKTQCGRDEYDQLSQREGVLAKARLALFFVAAAVRDWFK